MIFLQACGQCGKPVRSYKKGFEHAEVLNQGVKPEHKVTTVTTKRVA